MDIESFSAGLDGVFVGDPEEGRVSDERLEQVVSTVEGFTTAAELAVLNHAVQCLPPEEAYLEVGSFRGRSLCGALIDAPQRSVVAMENYLEFGMLGEEAQLDLESNLERWAPGRVDLRIGDAFDLLRPGSIDEPIGVYFYDGPHTYLAHYLALALVEPLLADRALVIIDDASWPMVERSTGAFLRRRDEWRVLREFRAPQSDDARWANGLLLLAFEARHPRPASPTRVDEALRLLQLKVQGPMNALAWRALHRYPSLVPVAKALVPKSSRAVPDD